MAVMTDSVTNSKDSKVLVVKEDFRLNATHRCDRCSAPAYVEALMQSGSKLLFCSHHYKAHAEALALLPQVVKIRDESHQLFK